MTHALKIKRAYEPAAPEDGSRVLVDRIWPRGVTKGEAALNLWLKEIAPSSALRTWYGHRPERWEEFRRRYYEELDRNPDAVAQLRTLLERSDVTLVFGARDVEHSHAVALLDYLEGAQHTGPASKTARNR